MTAYFDNSVELQCFKFCSFLLREGLIGKCTRTALQPQWLWPAQLEGMRLHRRKQFVLWFCYHVKCCLWHTRSTLFIRVLEYHCTLGMPPDLQRPALTVASRTASFVGVVSINRYVNDCIHMNQNFSRATGRLHDWWNRSWAQGVDFYCISVQAISLLRWQSNATMMASSSKQTSLLTSILVLHIQFRSNGDPTLPSCSHKSQPPHPKKHHIHSISIFTI